jgi:dipeptidyl aminopeptidase/acylaminoacyl peptidase
MNPDGSGVTRLTTDVGSDESPDWSPDGTKIAFDRDVNNSGVSEIYVMNADGSGVTRLTNNSAFDDSPSWSPDGTKIAFTSTRDDRFGEIYVMNADGSGVTNISNNPGYDQYPDWGTAPSSPPPPEQDTTPPILAVPDDIVADATSEQGAQLTYTVTAQDNVDGNATLEDDGTTVTQDDIGGDIDISCKPASGTTFPIGNTTVECSATDEAGNTGNASFTVTVNAPSPPPPPPEEDTTPPVLTVPEDKVVEANSTAGAQVKYTVTAQDNVDGTATLREDGTTIIQDDIGGNITISCDPPSGSVFPIGDTEVQCSATDEAGNEGTESFTVTVNPPPPPTPIPTAKQIIDRLISVIQNLDDDNVPQNVKNNLTAVLKQVSNILTDDNPNNDGSVCDRFDTFVNQVNAAERRDDDDDNTLTADQADELKTHAEDIRNELLLGC